MFVSVPTKDGIATGKPRALVVGGGIANFTDVAATFKGIIQARSSLCGLNY